MTHLTRTIATGVLLTIGAGIGVRAYYASRGSDAPALTTAAVSRGTIAETVAATGSLQAVTTVQVGTQVSGTVAWLGADFNSIVRKGQVVARLDPSLFDTQVEQARASLARATAELENAQVRVDDARQKHERARELDARQLVARSDLDAAKVALDVAQATARSAAAQVTQAEAALHQAELNLSHTIITAPIDGIVIGRSVDVGQTVAASLQSPTIFSIAADLGRMQLNASIDESDIGRIRPGEPVTFHVDAYPGEPFTGTVSQVRLQPSVVQNVTTYSVIIDVPNPALKLKPGMTANVTIEIAAREDVLRVPNAALRFRPTEAVLAALGQASGTGEVAAPLPLPQGGSAPPRSPRDGGEAADTPERRTAAAGDATAATTIDALFAPIEPVETGGRVWLVTEGRLQPLAVRLGLSDGQFTELVAGDLSDGMEVVTAASLATGTQTTTARATPAAGFLMPGPMSGGRPAGAQGGAR